MLQIEKELAHGETNRWSSPAETRLFHFLLHNIRLHFEAPGLPSKTCTVADWAYALCQALTRNGFDRSILGIVGGAVGRALLKAAEQTDCAPAECLQDLNDIDLTIWVGPNPNFSLIRQTLLDALCLVGDNPPSSHMSYLHEQSWVNRPSEAPADNWAVYTLGPLSSSSPLGIKCDVRVVDCIQSPCFSTGTSFVLFPFFVRDSSYLLASLCGRRFADSAADLIANRLHIPHPSCIQRGLFKYIETEAAGADVPQAELEPLFLLKARLEFPHALQLTERWVRYFKAHPRISAGMRNLCVLRHLFSLMPLRCPRYLQETARLLGAHGAPDPALLRRAEALERGQTGQGPKKGSETWEELLTLAFPDGVVQEACCALAGLLQAAEAPALLSLLVSKLTALPHRASLCLALTALTVSFCHDLESKTEEVANCVIRGPRKLWRVLSPQKGALYLPHAPRSFFSLLLPILENRDDEIQALLDDWSSCLQFASKESYLCWIYSQVCDCGPLDSALAWRGYFALPNPPPAAAAPLQKALQEAAAAWLSYWSSAQGKRNRRALCEAADDEARLQALGRILSDGPSLPYAEYVAPNLANLMSYMSQLQSLCLSADSPLLRDLSLCVGWMQKGAAPESVKVEAGLFEDLASRIDTRRFPSPALFETLLQLLDFQALYPLEGDSGEARWGALMGLLLHTLPEQASSLLQTGLQSGFLKQANREYWIPWTQALLERGLAKPDLLAALCALQIEWLGDRALNTLSLAEMRLFLNLAKQAPEGKVHSLLSVLRIDGDCDRQAKRFLGQTLSKLLLRYRQTGLCAEDLLLLSQRGLGSAFPHHFAPLYSKAISAAMEEKNTPKALCLFQESMLRNMWETFPSELYFCLLEACIEEQRAQAALALWNEKASLPFWHEQPALYPLERDRIECLLLTDKKVESQDAGLQLLLDRPTPLTDTKLSLLIQLFAKEVQQFAAASNPKKLLPKLCLVLAEEELYARQAILYEAFAQWKPSTKESSFLILLERCAQGLLLSAEFRQSLPACRVFVEIALLCLAWNIRQVNGRALPHSARSLLDLFETTRLSLLALTLYHETFALFLEHLIRHAEPPLILSEIEKSLRRPLLLAPSKNGRVFGLLEAGLLQAFLSFPLMDKGLQLWQAFFQKGVFPTPFSNEPNALRHLLGYFFLNESQPAALKRGLEILFAHREALQGEFYYLVLQLAKRLIELHRNGPSSIKPMLIETVHTTCLRYCQLLQSQGARYQEALRINFALVDALVACENGVSTQMAWDIYKRHHTSHPLPVHSILGLLRSAGVKAPLLADEAYTLFINEFLVCSSPPEQESFLENCFSAFKGHVLADLPGRLPLFLERLIASRLIQRAQNGRFATALLCNALHMIEEVAQRLDQTHAASFPTNFWNDYDPVMTQLIEQGANLSFPEPMHRVHFTVSRINCALMHYTSKSLADAYRLFIESDINGTFAISPTDRATCYLSIIHNCADPQFTAQFPIKALVKMLEAGVAKQTFAAQPGSLLFLAHHLFSAALHRKELDIAATLLQQSEKWGAWISDRERLAKNWALLVQDALKSQTAAACGVAWRYFAICQKTLFPEFKEIGIKLVDSVVRASQKIESVDALDQRLEPLLELIPQFRFFPNTALSLLSACFGAVQEQNGCSLILCRLFYDCYTNNVFQPLLSEQKEQLSELAQLCLLQQARGFSDSAYLLALFVEFDDFCKANLLSSQQRAQTIESLLLRLGKCENPYFIQSAIEYAEKKGIALLKEERPRLFRAMHCLIERCVDLDCANRENAHVLRLLALFRKTERKTPLLDDADRFYFENELMRLLLTKDFKENLYEQRAMARQIYLYNDEAGHFLRVPIWQKVVAEYFACRDKPQQCSFEGSLLVGLTEMPEGEEYGQIGESLADAFAHEMGLLLSFSEGDGAPL